MPKDYHVATGSVTLTPEQVIVVMGWLNVYRHEVNIEDRDMETFMGLEPMLPEEYRGTIDSIYAQYHNQ